jgi:tRNA threonylcarbamoyl adenosine modification protein YjeE
MTAPVTFSVALANEAATAQLMADLALLVGPGDVITLSGDLGAGKTAAARAMIRYLANDDALEVPSPTFTLAQSYDQPFPLLHADLYRINDASELEEIGLSPLPEGTLALIEWPERAPEALPHDRIDIAFSHRPALGSSARAAEFTGYGKAAAQVERLKALRQFAAASRRQLHPDEFAEAAGWTGDLRRKILQRRRASRRGRQAVRRHRQRFARARPLRAGDSAPGPRHWIPDHRGFRQRRCRRRRPAAADRGTL